MAGVNRRTARKVAQPSSSQQPQRAFQLTPKRLVTTLSKRPRVNEKEDKEHEPRQGVKKPRLSAPEPSKSPVRRQAVEQGEQSRNQRCLNDAKTPVNGTSRNVSVSFTGEMSSFSSLSSLYLPPLPPLPPLPLLPLLPPLLPLPLISPPLPPLLPTWPQILMSPVSCANFNYLLPYMHPRAQYDKTTSDQLQNQLQDYSAQPEDIENMTLKVHVATFKFIMKTPVLAQDPLFYEAAKATISQVSKSTLFDDKIMRPVCSHFNSATDGR